MQIDKQYGDVAFNELDHKYWNVNDNQQYVSVTTLIGKYEQEFDKNFWSAYKALEKLIPKESWGIEKRSLLNTKRFNKDILEIYNIPELEFNKVQQDILDTWAQKNKESCERGTKIHAKMESLFYSNPQNKYMKKFGIGGKFECKKGYPELDLEYGIYPEYLISRVSDDGILRIAGQIDLLIKQGNDIIIGDYKTNEKIDFKGGFDSSIKKTSKMKYPLNNCDDCNFIHYSLQLSTYAWMLQKINPEFVIKDLFLYHFDHQGNETLYHCEYMKHDVEKMLYDYKKKLIIENQRAKRKRIEY